MTAGCKCRGGLAHHHPEVEGIAVPTDQAPATKAGATGARPEQEFGSHTCRGGYGGISRIPGELDPAEPHVARAG
jgi:hypothetical protein